MLETVKHNKIEYIVWIDVETTGTDPERDEILEIGSLVTDIEGNKLGDPYEALFTVKNLSETMVKASETVQKMHETSRLWLDLWELDTKSAAVVDKEMLEWIKPFVDDDIILYFGGNSITLDRNFVKMNLPEFYRNISYRSVDVTSLSIAIQSNSSVQGYRKYKQHRALSDALDSVEEYRHYMNHITSL